VDPEEVEHGAVGVAPLPDGRKFKLFTGFVPKFPNCVGQDSLCTVALSLDALAVGFGGLEEESKSLKLFEETVDLHHVNIELFGNAVLG
jgi:hypothetical protein